MSTNTRLIHATPEQVWEVLCDGWLYPLWVVGASRMRDVDEHWPQVGAKLHHSVGTWPLLIDDNTEVLEARPPSLLELKARGWPAGTARVRLRLAAVGTETEVTIEEDVEDGPGRLVPKPLRDLQLGWRNVESLRRLAYVVEGRVSG
ncbi:SRPBCC family protein [Nocardioides sp. IC4_145]|uniref:SRPBCC family protein n=1 Tax=Nocardioides sp. IC4_145 TaxID=2714037 RepID=UPI00140E9686|nr:SRPBCC family protein [Nocardioides sp. IC4_145]